MRPVGAHPGVVREVTRAIRGGQAAAGGGVGLHPASSKLAGGFRRAGPWAEDSDHRLMLHNF